MSTAELLKPIFDDAIRSINFFNGRVLSGEDLSSEQQANRDGRLLLGQAVGDGVAHGLEVSSAPGVDKAAVVSVTAGLAVNRMGHALRLWKPIELSLLSQNGDTPQVATTAFADCEFRSGVYAAGAGVYLLVIEPASGKEGRAPVSGLGNTEAACNWKYKVEGVKFRLIRLELTSDELDDQDHLRSLVAHKCFGTADLKNNPLRSDLERYGLLDTMRPAGLTDCDVPLAVIHWTPPAGIRFVDRWTARRSLVDRAAVRRWSLVAGDRRVSEAEAMFLQFQDQIDAIQLEAGLAARPPASQITADQYFGFLPPAGYLPIGANGYDWKRFLGPMAPPSETPLDVGLFRHIIHRAFFHEPITVGSFALAMQPLQQPPVPVNVYRDPARNDFVLFARSHKGRIRVFLNPSPSASQSVDIHAVTDLNNTRLNASARTGGMFPIVDPPPGSYKVNVTAQGFQAVNPVTAHAVGGRTTDLVIALQPLPNGGILVTVTDLDGVSIGGKVSSVQAVSAQTGLARNGQLTAGDKWLISNLPPATYNITVAAPKYETETLAGVQVPLGQQIERTITVARTTSKRPKLCAQIKRLKQPLVESARFCMVLKCDKSVSRATAMLRASKQEAQEKIGNTHHGGELLEGEAASSQRRREDRFLGDTSESDFMFGQGGKGESIFQDEPPWSGMIQAEPLSPNVVKWLAEWSEWFDEEYPSAGIGRPTPAIYINPRYVPPVEPQEAPVEPEAYAVFGSFGVPLAINPLSRTTRRPVKIKRKGIRGVGDDVIASLEKCGVVFLDQLPGLWVNYVAEVTGEPTEYARYLIADSIKIVEEINAKRAYYDGVDAEAERAMAEMNLTDDVALANADYVELGRRLKSLGFANRLINQARQVVPPETWKLDELGFTKGQILALEERGIGAKGEFILKTESDAALDEVATTVSLDKDTLSSIRGTGLSQLTASSIGLAPSKEITSLPGVNAVIAHRLAQANVDSVEKLAAAKPTELASATGISEAAATKLVDAAGAASRQKIDVAVLAPVSKANATALKAAGIGTVSDIVTKDPAVIAAALGGDTRKANAVIEGAKLALSRKDR